MGTSLSKDRAFTRHQVLGEQRASSRTEERPRDALPPRTASSKDCGVLSGIKCDVGKSVHRHLPSPSTVTSKCELPECNKERGHSLPLCPADPPHSSPLRCPEQRHLLGHSPTVFSPQ